MSRACGCRSTRVHWSRPCMHASRIRDAPPRAWEPAHRHAAGTPRPRCMHPPNLLLATGRNAEPGLHSGTASLPATHAVTPPSPAWLPTWSWTPVCGEYSADPTGACMGCAALPERPMWWLHFLTLKRCSLACVQVCMTSHNAMPAVGLSLEKSGINSVLLTRGGLSNSNWWRAMGVTPPCLFPHA